jgi:[acyl-carrier-protein] S-malonyltransferase
MGYVLMFPGQGSQAVGMGKALAESYPQAREVFSEVDDALGQKLSTLAFEGPLEELTLTRNTQPALMAVSLAVVRVLESKGHRIADFASYVAGHSLGEYSALAAAGVVSIADTAKLLRIRGEAMQAAVPVGEGAMAAILGLGTEEVEALLKKYEPQLNGKTCQIANDNADGQVVISGHQDAVEGFLPLAKEKGAKRAIVLPVSAPFHCSLMEPAAQAMQEALAQVALKAPAVPVICNVTAAPESDVQALKANLVTQVTGRVRWRETLQWLTDQDGLDGFLELGSGKVLTGLARRMAKGQSLMVTDSPEDVHALLEHLDRHAQG